MRKALVAAVVLVGLLAGPAEAKTVSITASPNPAFVGGRVVHTVDAFAIGRLDVWVSARGFAQPRMGTLPAGTWSYECCPPQTAGTPAWHYRSSVPTTYGASYRFGADARLTGSYLSTATIGGSSASIWVRIL